MVAEPVSRLVDLDNLDEPLDRLIVRAAEARERIILRRGGAVLALVVPTVEQAAGPASNREKFRAVVKEASSRFADVPIDELESRIAEAVADVRSERSQQRRPAE